MLFDKVTSVATGSLILMPILVSYVWITLAEWLQHSETSWLILTIIFSSIIGVLVGWKLNPMIAYKRNSAVCVGGIPFPVHYGMSVEDGCISGYVSLRNFLLDVCYYCLVFITMGLLIYTTGAKYGLIASTLIVSVLAIGLKIFMLDVLKIYPIKIEVKK